MPDRLTCSYCGHEDWPTELYAQAGPGGGSWFCRNNKTCHERFVAKKRSERNNVFADYTPPVNEEGDHYRARDNWNHTCIVMVRQYKEEIVTPNSPQGAPGVIVDLVDLDNDQTYRNVLMMTGAIVDGFKAHAGTGKPLVIWWKQARANNGRDYPSPMPATPDQIQRATAYYTKNGDPFAVELGTVTDTQTPTVEPPY